MEMLCIYIILKMTESSHSIFCRISCFQGSNLPKNLYSLGIFSVGREHYQNTTKCFICLSSTRYPKSKYWSLKKVVYAIRKIRDENKMGFEIISPNPISNTNTGFSYTDSLMSWFHLTLITKPKRTILYKQKWEINQE